MGINMMVAVAAGHPQHYLSTTITITTTTITSVFF
jgi:hypothetical protein